MPVDASSVVTEETSTAVGKNLAAVRAQIERAALAAGRDVNEIELVAVTKTVPLDRIAAAYQLGLRDFGENRVQEGTEKIAGCAALGLTGARWHLVGHLQTNKVKTAVAIFDIIHSIDSVHLAEAVSRRAVAAGRTVPVLLDVNVAGEASKFGFSPGELPAALEQISKMPGLQLEGLMTVAPLARDPEGIRPVFRRLRELRDELRQSCALSHFRHLSMGMTDDYQVAIQEGATIVRLGRAIFGERRQHDLAL
ncbi:MAG: YggS family pyridoxal phosphate-dependent enzyme [Chloroflexi bacterium]|nr:YggS family pyridoxal phosphate-dependent enzyme [Chloroflexota bacterium]